MSKTRILIVGDDTIGAQALSDQLKELGAQPIAQTDTGEEALALAEQLSPALVLIDVRLAGGMDGIATAQAIRERFSIPVVFLTADLEEAILDRAKAAHPYGYLTKPFQPIELCTVIGLALTRHQSETQGCQVQDESATILRTVLDGCCIMDMRGRLLEVNDACTRMHGYTHEDMLGLSIADLEANESPDNIVTSFERVRQFGYVRFAQRHRCKDGRLIHVEVSVAYLPTSGGRFLCFLRDITERKRFEEVQAFLAQSSSGMVDESCFNALARYLAQSLGMDFVCVARLEKGGLTARTVAVWCDGHFEDNLTYVLKDTPYGEVVGKTVCCFPAGVGQSFPHDRVLKNLAAESFVGVTLWSHTGQPIGLIAVVGRIPLTNRALTEVTLKLVGGRAAGELERLDAEAALRESEGRFSAFMSHLPAGAFIKDTADRALYVNEYLQALLHFQNWETKTTLELVPGEMGQRMVEDDRKALAQGLLKTQETMTDCHGERHTFETIKFPIQVEEKPLLLGGIVFDVTERRRAEAEKEKLEAHNRQLQKSESLSRMAGAIAHHFNNQLQAVIMNLELAIQDLPRNAGPIENLTAAMHSARKAAEVSGLMLTYLGQTHCKREPLDLSEACQRHLPMLRAATRKDVVLETDLLTPGPTISANANQMQQVLTNLITNAWEASGDGRGVIRVSVKTVSAEDICGADYFPIDWQPQDNAYACLEVADAGCGIEGNDIEKLFDPFFSRKFTGRGLGLAVVLGIVRAHHGAITVESEPGRGSVFRVFLPLSAEAVPREPVQMAQPPRTVGAGTVLVVEDEPAVRKAVVLALERIGLTVLVARDGIEAVEMFREHQDQVGCVLCDLTMPRMNGWETLTALRKLAPGIPLILASGHSEAQVMEGDHPELPQAFLSKPYAFEKLRDVIASVMPRL